MSDFVEGQGASVETDPVSSFSFDGLHEKALAAFEGNTPAAAAGGEEHVQPETPEVTPEAETATIPEGEATNVDNASAAKLAQLSDDELVEVTVDGEKVTMPWKDAKGGVMRQAKFTKEMQALRAKEQEFAKNAQTYQQAQQEREALVQLLKSEDLMKQFLSKQYPHLLQAAQSAAKVQAGLPQSGQPDPDDIATVGQIQAAQQAYAQQVGQMVQQLQQEIAKSIEVATQTIEERQATAKLASEINTTINGLFDEHPHIQQLVPNANEMLRYEVAKLNPQTPDETLEAFKQVFGGWVETFDKVVGETQKQKVLAKQKLVQNNIQPPGGAAPQPAPQQFVKNGKADWDAMRKTALDMLGSK